MTGAQIVPQNRRVSTSSSTHHPIPNYDECSIPGFIDSRTGREDSRMDLSRPNDHNWYSLRLVCKFGFQVQSVNHYQSCKNGE